MVSERRHKRIEQEIQRVVATALESLTDPHLRLVTLTRVEVSDDMKTATLFYVTHKQKEDVQSHLNKIRGMMRSSVSREINLRYTPVMEFEYDKGLDYQMTMDNIIRHLSDEESGKKNT